MKSKDSANKTISNTTASLVSGTISGSATAVAMVGAAAAASIGYVATNGLKEIQKTDKQKPQTEMHRSFNASGAKQETVFFLYL